MKKTISIFLCVCLLLTGAVGCAKKPEKTLTAAGAVANLLDALTNLDFAEASKYTNVRQIIEFNEDGTLNESTSRYTTAFFPKLEYSIQVVNEVDEDTVFVTLTITAVDMTPVMEAFVSNLMMEIMMNEMDGVTVTEEQADQRALRVFDSIIAEGTFKTVTTTVDLEVEKRDDQWYVYVTESLNEALTGGITAAMDNAQKLLEVDETEVNQ